MAKKRIATFLGPQLGLSVIGSHAYAFSGAVTDIVQADNTMLDFNTGSEYIKSVFRFNTQTTDDDIRFTISFNGQIVQGYTIGSSNNHAFQEGLRIIIPPFTRVKCFGYNESSSTNRTAYASVSGRVYEL